MARKQTRTSFDRTQGLGSAREGVGHWWMQRVTALALIPLTLWFAASLIAHIRGDYSVLILWLRSPFTSVAMVLLLTALFCHMALGLQVIVEDYVHSAARFPALMAMRFGCFALATTGIAAVLRVCFGD